LRKKYSKGTIFFFSGHFKKKMVVLMNKHIAYVSVVLILFAIIMYINATMYCKEDDGQCRTSSYAVMGVSIVTVVIVGGYFVYKIFVEDFIRNRRAKAARIEMNRAGERRARFLEANQKRFEKAEADTTKKIEALGRTSEFIQKINKNRPTYDGFTAKVEGRAVKQQPQQQEMAFPYQFGGRPRGPGRG